MTDAAALAMVPSPAVPSRRGAELAMLVFAWGIAIAAYADAGYGVAGRWPDGLIGYGTFLAVLIAGAHMAVRRFARHADPVLLPCAVMLNGIGLAMIYRLDFDNKGAARTIGDWTPRGDAGVQLIWTAIAVLLFVAVLGLLRDHRTLQRYTYTCGAVGLVMLALPAVLPDRYSEVNGARIWVRLAGFSIQPGEFAKLLLIVFFAGYLVVKRDVLALASRRLLGVDLPRGRDLGPIITAWLLSIVILMAERDVGMSFLFFGVFVLLLYIATERTSWLFFGVAMFAAGGALAYTVIAHVHSRVDIWLHAFAGNNPSGKSYQLVQSLFGFATGGVLGSGLGHGHPSIVPFAKTDFIMATAGEELGLTGVMAILLVYATMVQRGLRTALAARDSFGKLLTAGLASVVALQVFVIVGGVTRLIPLTGLTTPFLSYGGSSLVANWALLALLLRVSDTARRPAPALPATTEADTMVLR